MQLRTRLCVLPILAVTLFVCTGFVTAPTLAASEPTQWNGKLLDADCKAASASEPCVASPRTANFGLLTSDNSFFRLDAKGNQLIKDKLKEVKKQGELQATITGRVEGDTIMVETVQIA